VVDLSHEKESVNTSPIYVSWRHQVMKIPNLIVSYWLWPIKRTSSTSFLTLEKCWKLLFRLIFLLWYC